MGNRLTHRLGAWTLARMLRGRGEGQRAVEVVYVDGKCSLTAFRVALCTQDLRCAHRSTCGIILGCHAGVVAIG
jgi:hypothetical protein